MSLYAYNSNVLLNTPLVLFFNDSVVVGAQGFVYSNDEVIFSTSTHLSIVVAGALVSDFTPISLGDFANPTQNNEIVVTASGLLSGGRNSLLYTGIRLNLVNAGTMNGRVFLDGGTSAGSNRIHNSGTISGDDAILGGSFRQSALTIINTGEIVGQQSGIRLVDAVAVGDHVINSGSIHGSVWLGGGADVYDGRGGGTVYGEVYGESGDDWFRPGAAEEYFDGGGGIDLLDFVGASGVVEIALDDAWEATGWAEGDTWVGIERVRGSSHSDRIGGDAADNHLSGIAGADRLFGQAGADTIVGGGGIDTLSGGLGNDAFLFQRLGECGDSLSDFSSAAAGNNDRFLISASGFGGGLVAGALAAARFHARADNVAQDADDRFIFRTTDRSLWFDADGDAAGAAIRVATLQPGATMTAADIFVF